MAFRNPSVTPGGKPATIGSNVVADDKAPSNSAALDRASRASRSFRITVGFAIPDPTQQKCCDQLWRQACGVCPHHPSQTQTAGSFDPAVQNSQAPDRK